MKILQNTKLTNTQIKFISLFAGCGGSSLGYTLAGLKECLAVEWDKNARKTFNHNFKDVPIYDWDISKLTGKKLLRKLKMKIGELDLFDASPPCQGFSSSNTKRDPNAVKNALYFKTIDLIDELQPKVFVIENVPGMLQGEMKPVWERIAYRFKQMAYRVEYKIVRAEEHGVPQARRRAIVIGVRQDIQDKFNIGPLFPKPNLEDLELMTVKAVCPNLYGYSAGQFADKFHYSSNYMCTITSTMSAWVYEMDGYKRRPTISELKKFSSFPQQFEFKGSVNQQWARIGNAVPPNITKAIGAHIKEYILTEDVLASLNNNSSMESILMAA